MYVLYHFPLSQHARRVVSLLIEAQLDYELRHVALDKGEHLSPQYLAVNPNHQVPTLIDGDVKIHESNAILRYLCVKHGLTSWYPDSAPLRAGIEQWLDWNQSRLSPAVVDIVLNKVFLGDRGEAAAIERGRAKLDELEPILDAGLAQHAFLVGEQPTIADLSLASSVFQLSLASVTPQGEHVMRWFRRVSDIEGFQRSLRAR